MPTKLIGRLVVSKGEEPWGKLQVPQPLVLGLFASLNEPGLELPEDTAHISVFTTDEINKIGGPSKIKERGRDFPFTLGGIKSVNPAGWAEMSRVYFMTCYSPELQKLRVSYGLTPKMYGKHPFHITFAVRRRGKLAPNKNIDVRRKMAAIDPKRLALSTLVGGSTGAVLDAIRRRKQEDDDKRKSWFERNRGLLAGLLVGGSSSALYDLINQHMAVQGVPSGVGRPSTDTGGAYAEDHNIANPDAIVSPQTEIDSAPVQPSVAEVPADVTKEVAPAEVTKAPAVQESSDDAIREASNFMDDIYRNRLRIADYAQVDPETNTVVNRYRDFVDPLMAKLSPKDQAAFRKDLKLAEQRNAALDRLEPQQYSSYDPVKGTLVEGPRKPNILSRTVNTGLGYTPLSLLGVNAGNKPLYKLTQGASPFARGLGKAVELSPWALLGTTVGKPLYTMARGPSSVARKLAFRDLAEYLIGAPIGEAVATPALRILPDADTMMRFYRSKGLSPYTAAGATVLSKVAPRLYAWNEGGKFIKALGPVLRGEIPLSEAATPLMALQLGATGLRGVSEAARFAGNPHGYLKGISNDYSNLGRNGGFRSKPWSAAVPTFDPREWVMALQGPTELERLGGKRRIQEQDIEAVTRNMARDLRNRLMLGNRGPFVGGLTPQEYTKHLGDVGTIRHYGNPVERARFLSRELKSTRNAMGG